MKVTIQREPITYRLLDEAEPLLLKHEEEINILSYPLNHNKLLYIKAGSEGKCVVYTARSDESLVGYVCYWIADNPHYGVRQATQDVLFIHEDYRKGRVGINLLKESEKDLKDNLEVRTIYQHTKRHKKLDRLFEYLSYKESDKLYVKEL